MSTAGQRSTAEHCGENDRLEFFSAFLISMPAVISLSLHRVASQRPGKDGYHHPSTSGK
jgi:hypothetical protein